MIGEHSPVPSEPRRARWRSAGIVYDVFSDCDHGRFGTDQPLLILITVRFYRVYDKIKKEPEEFPKS